MSVYIKGMEMPVDCLACRLACDKENYGVIGRPPKCPLTEAKTGDIISRADAIEAVKHSTAYMHDDLYEAISIRIPSAETTGALDDAIAKYVADGLMELPSADAEWIPCSERLPGKNQEVLLQCHHNMIVGYWMDGDFDGEKEWRVLSGDGWESGCDFPNDVFEPLAWMPLPKPYREDGDA